MLDYLIPFLTRTFAFDANSPLLFTQFYFWGFFAVVFAFLTLIKNRIALRNAFLFATSLFFYYKTSGSYVCILIFCVVANFFIGKWIEKAEAQWKKKFLMIIVVIIDLLVLCYYKYSYFFLDALYDFTGIELHVYNFFAAASNKMFGTHSLVDTIILPVGISFFTFQAMSYCIDIYRGKISAVKNILDFGFYLSFFPQLVAGPIVRADKFVPQLYKKFFLPRRTFGIAVFWILNGLAKKIILSDYLATNFVDRVFDTPLLFTGLENLIALFAYSLQVYADFSGYTDIAIGVALLMGFRLPQNFNSPYKALSPTEFWRRWHISLSSWWRDYLYIPLGGNRGASVGTFFWMGFLSLVAIMLSGSVWVGIALGLFFLYIAIYAYLKPDSRKFITTNMNAMSTQIVGGWWHGASWNFIIWGGLNGFGQVFNKIWVKRSRTFRAAASFILFATSAIIFKQHCHFRHHGSLFRHSVRRHLLGADFPPVQRQVYPRNLRGMERVPDLHFHHLYPTVLPRRFEPRPRRSQRSRLEYGQKHGTADGYRLEMGYHRHNRLGTHQHHPGVYRRYAHPLDSQEGQEPLPHRLRLPAHSAHGRKLRVHHLRDLPIHERRQLPLHLLPVLAED